MSKYVVFGRMQASVTIQKDSCSSRTNTEVTLKQIFEEQEFWKITCKCPHRHPIHFAELEPTSRQE